VTKPIIPHAVLHNYEAMEASAMMMMMMMMMMMIMMIMVVMVNGASDVSLSNVSPSQTDKTNGKTYADCR
jgi:hypothetical protein